MPIFERYARGTRWIVDANTPFQYRGKVVEVLEEPYGENVMIVHVRPVNGGDPFLIELSYLLPQHSA